MKKKKRQKGVNITVSPKAYEKISTEALLAKPRRNLREQVNIMSNLPKEE